MSTWIFLRGLTRESRHWARFPDAFAGAIADARIVLLDLPGNGRLHDQRSPAAVERLVEFCRSEMRRRTLPPPFRLLAMSLGAMVAVSWAQHYPDELRGCVLINTSLRPFSPFYQRLRPVNYWPLLWLLRVSSGAQKEEQQEDLILRLTSRNAAASAAVHDDWVALRRECPVARGNALRQVLAAARFRACNSKPVPPLLVLASSRDELVDVRCSRALARVWEASLAEHPSAGHDLPLDDGPWVVRQVATWLETSSSPVAAA